MPVAQSVASPANTRVSSQNATMQGYLENDTNWQPLPSDDWTSLQLDNTDSMMMLFDNYLAGNPSTMPIYENDLTRFDMM